MKRKKGIVMKAIKKFIYLFWALFLVSLETPVKGYANLTYNDPYPLFSTIFPYSYLTDRQKAQLMQFEYAYPVSRFQISVSGYRESANFGRNRQRDAVNLGDMPFGRWNMLSFFWDPVLRDQLFNALQINFDGDIDTINCNPTIDPVYGCFCPNGSSPCTATPCSLNGNNTFCTLTQPIYSDPNKEFGFFTIPLLYRKYGVRFESYLLLVDRCFYSIGLKAQFGVANITQRVLAFEDLTCQALGIACPVFSNQDGMCQNNPFLSSDSACCPTPNPASPIPVAVPYVDESTNPIPPCPAQAPCVPVGPTTASNCVELPQSFQACCNSTACFSYDVGTKKLVIEKIMRQKNIITEYLGLNINSFDKVGLEDARLMLFWRQVFVINEEDEFYPRLVFIPWAEAGVAVPMSKQRNLAKPFSLPIGNNDHLSAGLVAGFTLGYLDTIDLNFAAGFTKFFEREVCNYGMPTNPKESGLFPYSADVKLKPGTTWQFNASMNAYHFLDNLSFWAEYVIVSHRHDEIKVCRSHIPSTSIYYSQGFLVELAEDYTKWEAQFLNMSFNYDLSPFLSIGIMWQAPVKQRNTYIVGTVLGSLTITY